MTGLNHFACPQTVTFPVHSIRWLRKKLRLAIVIIMLLLFLCVCFSGWNQHKCCVSQHKCERSAYVCVCVSWCACVCVWACVGVCMETCEHVCVCVRLHIHPNLHTYSLHVHTSVCVCACARACVCVLDPWSFPPILSPWNARFSLLLAVVPGKYSYVLGQQPSWCIPPASGKLRAPVHCVYYITCVKIEMKGVHWIRWILR